jgi:hypothetical protein
MRGDFTRDTRERARRSGTRAVLLQQGRQLLDADWNEQAGLAADREETLARHVIGQHGAPRDDAGFAITVQGGDLGISAGSLYAEGLHVVNRVATTYATQPAAALLPALATTIPDGQEGLIYLEALLRPASVVSDPNLAEPALAGADTVVRETVAWTVQAAALSTIDMNRGALIAALDQNKPVTIAAWTGTTGGLDADVQTEAEAGDPGPCDMPPSAGYLDQLNRLYRVEIHDAGDAGTASFKWTEDAGREAGLRPEGAGFAIDLPIARAAEWFPVSAIVEVIDEARMNAGMPGRTGTITSAPGAALQISGVSAADLSTAVRIRRWATLPVTIPADLSWLTLSKGIKIRFATGHYASGSSWVIPGRTLTGDIIWPPYQAADLHQAGLPFYAPSDGRRRHAALAIIKRNGAGFAVTQELRDLFPPLTDITADDVRFDDSHSKLGAATVQEAIEKLAGRGSGCCTYDVKPGPRWHEVFQNIPQKAHATICFAPGNYKLASPILIQELGHVRLQGSGQGTKIWCYGDTSALRFERCASVEVRNMVIAAERQAPPPDPPAEKSETTAALHIRDCGPVHIESTTLIAAGRRWRQTACLRVSSEGGKAMPGSGTVTIENCDIVPGDLAGGILVLNGTTVKITGNRIRPRSEPESQTYRRWADDATVSAALGRMLASHATNGADAKRPVTRIDSRLFKNWSAIYFDHKINYFGWTAVTEQVWREFHTLHADYLQKADARQVKRSLKRILSNMWASSGVIKFKGQPFDRFAPLVTDVMQMTIATIDTAITVAGAFARDVTVSGNSIEGAFHGVRVALSDGKNQSYIRASTVRVMDNYIRLRVAPVDIIRRGVMIGNVERCWVADNDVAMETADAWQTDRRLELARKLNLDTLHAEAITVFGSLGPVIHLRGNSVQRCAAAYTLKAFTGTYEASKQWLAQGNYAESARYSYRLDNRCKAVDNVP